MTPRRAFVTVIVLSAGIGASSGKAVAKRAGERWARATTSSAQPPVEAQACLAAFRSAELHVQAGHLRAAQDRLLVCAQAICDKFIRRQCTQRYSNLEPEIPSVIPLVNDDLRKPVSDVRVTFDDEVSDWPADGRAISVDPGHHQLTFSTGGKVVAREDLLILQGQRNRTVEVSLGGRDAGVTSASAVVAAPRTRLSEPSSERGQPQRAMLTDAPFHPARRKSPRLAAVGAMAEPRHLGTEPRIEDDAERSPLVTKPSGPLLAYALGGLGVVAAGAGGLLTYWGRMDNDRLAVCSPACTQTSVDHVHRLYIGADVAFGVGAVLIAGATWAYSHHRSRRSEASVQTALRVDVQPTSSGAVAGVRGTF